MIHFRRIFKFFAGEMGFANFKIQAVTSTETVRIYLGI